MRRGHGSTKVPGVKLRPSAPIKSSSASVSSLKQPAWVQQVQQETDYIDSVELLKSSRKPFSGIIICPSGVSDKSTLFQRATELGAQANSDLTDRVTHLICEGPGSAKYNFCVAHGIPIVKPSWINDSYSRWIEGETIDVKKLMEQHRLPPFTGVSLCITGISDVQNRKSIRKLLEKNGGKYIEEIDNNTQLTHLLCGPDRGDGVLTAKMQAVEKLNRKRTGKAICLVWENWFWDCLEFKGQFNENEYTATGPRPGKRILKHVIPIKTSLSSTAGQRLPPDVDNTKSDDQEEEEMVIMKRLPGVTTRLWEGLLRGRGFQMKEGRLIRSPDRKNLSKSGTRVSKRTESPPSPSNARSVENNRTVIDAPESALQVAFKRTKSFAVKSDFDSSKSSLQHTSLTPKPTVARTSSIPAPSLKDKHILPEGERQLFIGLRFRLLGEASSQTLTEALSLRGGLIVSDEGEVVDYIVIRLASGSSFYLKESDPIERAKYRTECWVEQCIFEEKICSVNKHPAFTPLKVATPITGAEQLKVHLSGLAAWEKTPSTRLIKAIGGSITEQFSRKNTHLICPCGTGLKCAKAVEWDIPVVDLRWLFSTVQAGTVQDSRDFLVQTSIDHDNTGMKDITNEFVQGSSKTSTGRADGLASCAVTRSNSAMTSDLMNHKYGDETNKSNRHDEWDVNNLLSTESSEICTAPATSDCHPPPTSDPVTPIPSPQIRPTRLPPERKIGSFYSPTKSKIANAQDSRIPSSATPSPLKIPSKSTTSPTILRSDSNTVSSGVSSSSGANVLREAISSLLGKRSLSDDMDNNNTDDDNNYGVRTQTGVVNERRPGSSSSISGPATKRIKPPPRMRSRPESGSGPGPGTGLGLVTTPSLFPVSVSRTASSSSSATSNFLFSFPSMVNRLDSPVSMGDGGEGGGDTDTENESESIRRSKMRVTYQEPEELKLLSILSGSGTSPIRAPGFSKSTTSGDGDEDVDMNDGQDIMAEVGEDTERKLKLEDEKSEERGEVTIDEEDEPSVRTKAARGRKKNLVRRVSTRRRTGS